MSSPFESESMLAFITDRSVEYYYNPKSGLYTVVAKSMGEFTPIYENLKILGSISTAINPAFCNSSTDKTLNALMEQIKKKEIPGFIQGIRKNNIPLGINNYENIITNGIEGRTPVYVIGGSIEKIIINPFQTPKDGLN